IASDAAMALNVSPQTEQIIATLIGAGGLWASQCTNVPMWKALITNQTGTAQQFKGKVDAYLSTQSDPDAMTQIIYANFGVFGELPVVAVSLSDAYILMDPTNGNLSGPFELGSALDARGLLGQHGDAYQANTGVRCFASNGCPTEVAASWKPWPGPGAAPGRAPPVAPATPGGGTGNFVCRARGGGGYICERFACGAPLPACPPGVTPGVPPLGIVPATTYPVREICTLPGGCEPLGFPGPVSPAYPCGAPRLPGSDDPCAVPPTQCTPKCRIEFWY
ncbi:MAG: hypothetical protein K2W85_10375, partial [Phycisphaerales bacterium]|nr:hypothetical protein [Phycisphaerales bacterium]